MFNGWIKLHRQIMDNPLYFDKPFCRGMAFIDLLLLANHDEKEIFFNGSIITVNRGSFITSYEKLSDRWGWSTTKIRKFFIELKKQNAITTESDEKKTVVSLVNYSVYQGSEHTENIQKTYKEHTEVIQKNTNKNVKNDNNEKNDIYTSDQNEIYYRASMKSIQEIVILKHSVFRFIGQLSKDEIFDCIDRSEGKHTNYLLTVLQTKVDDKKKKPPPRSAPQPSAARNKKSAIPFAQPPQDYKPLSDTELDELYQLTSKLDKGGEDF